MRGIPLANSFLSNKQLHIQNHLAVLPCGDLSDKKIINWTAAQLKPYLSFILKGQSMDTMFEGLIFNTISTRKTAISILCMPLLGICLLKKTGSLFDL